MAGTGGTSSSVPADELSIRVFKVGNLEVEKLCDNRAAGVKFTIEL